MKKFIIESNTKHSIPEVGDYWGVEGSDRIYMRIEDKIGKVYFNDVPNCFYSINEAGCILYQSFNTPNIIVYKVKTPATLVPKLS